MKFKLLVWLLFLTGCAGTVRKTPRDWVERTLRSLSLEQKVAQMLVPAYIPRFFNRDDASFQRLSTLVRDYQVGGVMFYKGPPYEVTRSVERLQAVAEIPLLVMADMEWGLAQRVRQATEFPTNMAVGATGKEAYAYEIGRITAQEARAVGVHIGFAPVMDVNNNPDNVIINTRAYGEDPQLVSKLGAAFIRGLQEHGVYATAKHFPGHGDTEVDSHLALPVIDAPRERLRRVELPPFQAAVEAGVKCVMVGHITFTDVPEMAGRPASLDPYFIQTVLREQMGFDGLVLTDALEMGGITQNYWSGEAAVLAVNAGIDLLLVPPNFESTFRFLVEAARTGRIPRPRVDAAVRRILTAKADFGLPSRPAFDPERLETVLARPEFARKAEEIAEAAVTLVRDRSGTVPLHAEALDTVLVVAVADEEGAAPRARVLQREVARRIPTVLFGTVDPRSSRREIERLTLQADSAQAVVVGLFVSWRDHKGALALPDTTVKLLQTFLAVDKPLVVASFGSPYVLRQLPQVPTYLCAYEGSGLAQRAAVRALFGEIPVNGRLPVSIPGLHRMGDGLRRPARKMVLVPAPDDTLLAEAYAVLERGIADSVFPGAQVAVVHRGRLIASRGFGRQTYDPDSPRVTPNTVYDLASITKVAATTVTAMRLWEQGKLLLDVPVKSYLPEFTGGLKDSVTVRHLLTHSSGVHWWVDLWNHARDRAEALEYVYRLPLDYAPGDSMIYSDLGLILLGQILETITGKPLDRLADQLVFRPMGMRNTRFNPPQEWLPRIAPTEVGGGLNRGLIHGQVHDENAYFLGGVSAHAGLFSTAEDLAALAQMLLNGGMYRHHRFFSPATVKYWTTRQNLPPGSPRALGWTTPTDEGSSAGDYFSPGSFGHTGFTGTSLWIDPNRKIAVVLLTNRVHPTRERGGIYEVRRAFHNAVMRALLDMQEAPTK